MKRDAFIRMVAGFAPYEWSDDESWTDDQAEDALTVMNRLIAEARKIEVEDAAVPCCACTPTVECDFHKGRLYGAEHSS